MDAEFLATHNWHAENCKESTFFAKRNLENVVLQPRCMPKFRNIFIIYYTHCRLVSRYCGIRFAEIAENRNRLLNIMHIVRKYGLKTHNYKCYNPFPRLPVSTFRTQVHFLDSKHSLPSLPILNLMYSGIQKKCR